MADQINTPKDTHEQRGTQRVTEMNEARRAEAAKAEQETEAGAATTPKDVVVDTATGEISDISSASLAAIMGGFKTQDFPTMVHEALANAEQGTLDPTKRPLLVSGLKSYFRLLAIADGFQPDAVPLGTPFNTEQIPPGVEALCQTNTDFPLQMVVAGVDGQGMTAMLSKLNYGTDMQDAISYYTDKNDVSVTNCQVVLGRQMRTALGRVASVLPVYPDVAKSLKKTIQWGKGPAAQAVLSRESNDKIRTEATATAKADAPPPVASTGPTGTTVTLTSSPSTPNPPAPPTESTGDTGTKGAKGTPGKKKRAVPSTGSKT